MGRTPRNTSMRPSLLPTGPSESDRRTVALAKTTRPSTAVIVPRERLFQRIDADARRSLVWICGPAGSGKTSLAASYVAERERLCLWYELDPDDEDEATFFHYFSEAVTKHLLPPDRLPPPIGAGAADDVGRFARAYFREVYSQTRTPWVLVLDGFSPASPESRLYDVLDAAAGQAPANGLVIVTSRDEPPPALARLRVAGEMVTIDAALLELDPAEMCQVAQLRGQPLAPEDARRLHEGLGGWAAALVLVLEHAKLAGHLPDLPVESAPKAVFDYLAGEVFERFDERMRRFLLRCACLRRMTPAIAQAITGEERATRLLLNLATNHYFVSEARWDGFRGFRFHPLMREFLLQRARSHLPEVLDVAHLRRAARVLREAGHTEDAVALLLECKDWAALAEVAAQDAELMLAQGRAESLAAWIEALPAALLDADPRLWLALARCRMAVRPRAARHHFEQGAHGFARLGDAAGEQEACTGVIECLIAEFDDLAALDRWASRAAELDRAMHASGSTTSRKAGHSLAVAQLLRVGAHAQSPGLRSGGPAAPGSAPAGVPGPPDWPVAIACALHGETARADALLAGSVAADPATAGATAGPALARALLALIGGDFPGALAHLDEAALPTDVTPAGIWPVAMRTAIALARGEVETAREQCARLAAASGSLRRGERALHLYLRGWLAVLEADSLEAVHAYQAAAATAEEAGLVWLQAFSRLGIAKAQAEVGDLRGAQRTLRSIDNAFVPFPAWRFARALAQAALQLAQGLPARDAIADAFAVGREHGIEFAPGWAPHELARLFALALDAGVEAGYARRVVRRQALTPREAPLAIRDWPWPVRVRALGGFEIERDGKSVEFSGKGPGRPLELLKVLLAMGGQGVRVHQLADALWPNTDADYAHKSFTTALHRLRRLLECDEALVLSDGRLSFDAVCVWTDAGALNAALQRIDALTRTAAAGAEPALQQAVEQALALYRGPFLPDESDQPDYLAWREQLRARLLRHLAGASRVWEMQGHAELAVDAYQRLIDADPLFEAAYRHLMLCHQRRGDASAARELYERLRTTLSMRLRVMPSAQTQELYATLDAAPR